MALAAPAAARPTVAPAVLLATPTSDVIDGEFLTRSGDRWRRIILRVVARWNWAKDGLKLALIKRPDLLFLPFPWPSVFTFLQWKVQAETMTMVRNGAHPRRWLGRGNWTAATLTAMTWFRGRFGLALPSWRAPFCRALMAVSGSKGRAARVRSAMVREAEAARALIGPRGELPSLKQDLLKLAALLHVPVTEKDKVDLKAKVRLVLGALKGTANSTSKPAPLTSSGSMSSSLSRSPQTFGTLPTNPAVVFGCPHLVTPRKYDGRCWSDLGPRERECFHVLHGGDGPAVPDDAGAGRTTTTSNAQPGVAARHEHAEHRPSQRTAGIASPSGGSPRNPGWTNAWLTGTVQQLKPGQR